MTTVAVPYLSSLANVLDLFDLTLEGGAPAWSNPSEGKMYKIKGKRFVNVPMTFILRL